MIDYVLNDKNNNDGNECNLIHLTYYIALEK